MDKKILLIEDEDFVRELYARQLVHAEFDTDAFATGKEGLDAAQKNKYNLILLDIMLPDINGIDILKKLKGDESTKDIPVVFLTNLALDDVIHEGLKLGAVGYLIKSKFTPEQMVEEVKHFFERSSVSSSFPSS